MQQDFSIPEINVFLLNQFYKYMLNQLWQITFLACTPLLKRAANERHSEYPKTTLTAF